MSEFSVKGSTRFYGEAEPDEDIHLCAVCGGWVYSPGTLYCHHCKRLAPEERVALLIPRWWSAEEERLYAWV